MTTKSKKSGVTRKREHRTGKTNGFGYETDGESYWIAPCYCDPMEQLIDQKNGIAALITALNEDFTRRHAAIAKDQREWWKTVCADLGLANNAEWSYFGGRIFKTPKHHKDEK